MGEIFQIIKENPEGMYITLGFVVFYLIWRKV